MKYMIAATVVFAAHVTLFVAAYYGRTRGYPLFGSDLILFGLPFLLAAAAYAGIAISWARGIQKQTCGLNIFAGAVLLAGVSALSGMTVAFNLMGT